MLRIYILMALALWTVLSVYDGDTITVQDPQGKIAKVRFSMIDAPEVKPKQAGGIAARDFLRKLILGKQVELGFVTTDKYGRSVADVYCEGQNINLRMVMDGHAWRYDSFAGKETVYATAQAHAQTRKHGLWRYKHPTPPWEFRREAKKHGKRKD